MYLLTPFRRLRHSREWDSGKAVTFSVTLSDTGSVTLAARDADEPQVGLCAENSQFRLFFGVGARFTAPNGAGKGNKVEEVHGPPVSSNRSYTPDAGGRVATAASAQ